MNFISHHETAVLFDSKSSLSFLTGSMVYDLRRISGLKNTLSGLNNEEMLRGIDFHKATNTAFDNLPQIIEIEESMKELFNKFLPWRTSIQASRAGKDLLFDSIQFKDKSIIEDLMITLENIYNGEVIFSGVENPKPIVQVAGWLLQNGPPRYDDPEIATQRLYGTLSQTRTPIDMLYFDYVLKVMQESQSKILKIGSLSMNQTVNNLKNNFSLS